MSKIICIGSTLKDIFFPTSDGIILETPEDITAQRKIAFELGAKFHVERRYETLGGCATNVAGGLARLGENVSSYTIVGDDMIGKWIRKEFATAGIGQDLMIVAENCQSDLSAIIVDSASGERTIFSNRPANEKFEIDADKLGGADWIFIGDLSGQWQDILDVILKAAREKNIRLAFNPNQKTIHDDVKKIIEALHFCELLSVNRDEAIEIVSGCGEITVRELLENEEYLVKVLCRLGAGTVILTDGARGAWGYDGNELLHAEALMQKAVDSTGAGDAFNSGFLAAYIKRKGLKTALQWGIANSSSSLKEYGGQKGLLAQEEIESVISDVKIKKLG